MHGIRLGYVPPLQDHNMADEPLSLEERMDRQERALGELRQDTARRFGEMRASTNAAIEGLRKDVHSEFTSINTKLDKLITAVDQPKKLTR